METLTKQRSYLNDDGLVSNRRNLRCRLNRTFIAVGQTCRVYVLPCKIKIRPKLAVLRIVVVVVVVVVVAIVDSIDLRTKLRRCEQKNDWQQN